jgi:hypothetical protein
MWKVTEINNAVIQLDDEEGWWSAIVKWDGCVDFYRYHNWPKGETPEGREEVSDYIHICDVDDLIARLQALKEAAKTNFDGWPG